MLSRVTERLTPKTTMAKNQNKLEQLDIYKEAFPFSVYLCRVVKNFDRAYKFIVGDDIIKATNKMRALIVKANNQMNKAKAAEYVTDCLSEVDIIDDLTSLALELGLMSIEQKAICDTHIGEIRSHGKRWRKYFQRAGESAGSDREPAESL